MPRPTKAEVEKRGWMQALVDAGYNVDEVSKMPVDKLKELYAAVESSNNLMSEAVESQDIIPSGNSTLMGETLPDERPSFTDPKWTDYVLTLFDKSELENGNPKADGLRRVAEYILGPFNTITNVEQVPTVDNAGRATVVVTVSFMDGRTVSGAADVFSGNTDKKFAVHPVATAETRAEGRALRKALRLTKVLTAEELQNADADEPNGEDNRIVTGMLNSLIVMCDRLGVDLLKLALWMKFEVNSTDELTKRQGLDISNKLAKFQRKEEEIPNEVRK